MISNRFYKSLQWSLPSLAVLIASCTKSITIKVPDYKPEIVINSVIDADEFINTQVTQSVSLKNTNGNPPYTLMGATVTLYTNGIISDTLGYDPTTNRYVSHTAAKAGNQYTLKVSAPSFTDAQATTVVPTFAAITDVNVTYGARTGSDGNLQDELQVSFTDPVTPGDYYIVKVTQPNDSFSSYGDFCLSSTDASIETIDDESIDGNTCLSSDNIFLRDQLFNGKAKQLNFFVGNGILGPHIDGNGDTVYALIKLYHVSEEFFRYQKSYLFAQGNQDNPFSEPINVYTNVKNGYGIFSVNNMDVRPIK